MYLYCQAGIPEYYCVCIPETYLPVRSPLIFLAAKTLLRQINLLISNHTHLCQPQTLRTVLEARRLQNNSRKVRWGIIYFVAK